MSCVRPEHPDVQENGDDQSTSMFLIIISISFSERHSPYSAVYCCKEPRRIFFGLQFESDKLKHNEHNNLISDIIFILDTDTEAT